ncbi:MAG: DUF1667 domain-containing protein [Ruminococcaceae bacterium]|nr:DUF1667 domain-containing protein [Oscillospiraceae bacterium]
MTTKQYVCIVCPMSCSIELTDDSGVLTVEGNTCKRGEEYAKNEYTDPKRMITTTVGLRGSRLRCLPVISREAVPKKLLRDCMKQLYATVVDAPVRQGDVIVANILGTGVDIIAARSITL